MGRRTWPSVQDFVLKQRPGQDGLARRETLDVRPPWTLLGRGCSRGQIAQALPWAPGLAAGPWTTARRVPAVRRDLPPGAEVLF